MSNVKRDLEAVQEKLALLSAQEEDLKKDLFEEFKEKEDA